MQWSARAPSPSTSTGSRMSSSIWCSRARARATRAELAEAIEDVGGSINAWTARDQTVFYGRTLAKDAPLLAELIADFLRAPHLDEEHLEREKAVILSELGEVVDSPDDLVHDHLFEAAFEGQPLGRSVLGRAETSERDHAPRIAATGFATSLCRRASSFRRAARSSPARSLKLAERLFGDMERLARRSDRPRRVHRRRPQRPPRVRAGALVPRPSGLRRIRPAAAGAVDVRPGARRRHVVAAVPGAARGARPRLFGQRLEPGLCRYGHRRAELRRRPQSSGRIDAPCARGSRRRGREADRGRGRTGRARSSKPGC